MLLNPAKLNLITSALRACAMGYEQQARILDVMGKRVEAMHQAKYAEACAALAEEIEKDSTRPSGIQIATIKTH